MPHHIQKQELVNGRRFLDYTIRIILETRGCRKPKQ